MGNPGRWDPCVSHSGVETSAFMKAYFDSSRSVLLIAGAGFDPRATIFPKLLSESTANVQGTFLREVRPQAPETLNDRANENVTELTGLLPDSEFIDVEIFGGDGAVLGGRRTINAISALPFEEFTDVIVDISALSIGSSFPLVRFLVERCDAVASHNVHVVVAHDSALDSKIQSTSGDRPGWIHGFTGDLSLDGDEPVAKLWIPQLAFGAAGSLAKIHDLVNPHDTCPILPFPSRDPRLADRLAEEFIQPLENTWNVDLNDVVWADEDDPLDLYRTIIRLDDRRRPVFEGSGGSRIILSPAGSKVTALGALMAALERDLPIAYMEADGYVLVEDAEVVETSTTSPHLVHVWLEGDVYPEPRAPLMRAEDS